jgi:hypothetical protein
MHWSFVCPNWKRLYCCSGYLIMCYFSYLAVWFGKREITSLIISKYPNPILLTTKAFVAQTNMQPLKRFDNKALRLYLTICMGKKMQHKLLLLHYYSQLQFQYYCYSAFTSTFNWLFSVSVTNNKPLLPLAFSNMKQRW